ncbi:GNAT family N-acetyltransferase [Longibacter salinarum]|uniref:GNAT family N-acetyltransferase n=1 Tax=Longibacter salinarum TaxID=1850348 RepID=A0A2A8CU41_9BACT|nr:GNAT family N-acetyltransferase [Longibacter salinarum]PEN11270.1 GNAT family N-acetyltransferase [Longibacter salinarum]
MKIRTADLSDVETLVEFNQAMAQETEDKSLDTSTLQAGVRALMLDSKKGFYLVAERNGTVVGSLMITTEWSDWRNGTFWWVQSVYVRLEARREGVYSALYAHVKAMARNEDDVCGIRLYVEKDNAAARTTYENLGMNQTAYRMYEQMI